MTHDLLVLIRETRALLVSMLDDAGVHRAAPDVNTTVEVFRRFAAVPVEGTAPPEDDGDGVLAQFGTVDLPGRNRFSADLTRQFLGAGGGWQLSCALYWPADADTDALSSGHLWAFGMPLDAFFAGALALPGWAWALDGRRAPRSLEITLDEI